jgi:pimeloyl-ACP methyl ester carboxylesterase
VSGARSGVEEIDLHGRRLAVRRTGAGPVVVLLHGLGAGMHVWDGVHDELAGSCTVISLDLPGHGGSAAPPGDYSLGAYACVVRDLLDALGVRRATLVGHSLGGGIALQFGYQFPERCDGLVLVASGGLGSELSPWLRAATLPGARLVLDVLASAPVARLRGVLRRLTRRAPAPKPPVAELPAAAVKVPEHHTFLRCLRAVADHRGQRVDATDRLYLLQHLPTLLVWGGQDPMIPVAHAHRAHAAMPHSRLEIFEASGHCPHLDEPARFARVVEAQVAAERFAVATGALAAG